MEVVTQERFVVSGNKTYRPSGVKWAQRIKDVEDLKNKLDKKTKEAATVQARVRQLYDRFETTVENERKDLEDHVSQLNRELQHLRRELEQANSSKKIVEGKLEAKEQELAFRSRCHEQDMTVIMARRSREIQEVHELAEKEYEIKLKHRSDELQEEFQAQLQEEKKNLDNFYELKISLLRSQLQRLESSSKSKGEELAWLSSRCDAQTKQVSALECEKNELLIKIQDLEAKVEDDRSKFVEVLNDRDHQINILTSEKSALIVDYQNLIQAKLGVVSENTSYREMFEREDKRRSYLPRRSEIPNGGSAGCMELPRVNKRKCEEDKYYANDDREASKISHSHILISEDPQRNFIQLENKSEKEVSIAMWQLLRLSEDIVIIHEFNREAKINGRGTVTIWSSNAADGVHEPPENIVMNGKKWHTSGNSKTVLTDATGQEQAVLPENRFLPAYQRKRLGLEQPKEMELKEAKLRGGSCVIS